MNTVRWLVRDPGVTVRNRLWRVLYLLDVKLGTRRLAGNRRRR